MGERSVVAGLLFVGVTVAAASGGARAAECGAPPAMNAALAKLLGDESLAAEKAKELERLLAREPGNLYIEEAYGDLLSGELLDYAGALDRYQTLARKSPDDLKWSFLSARLISYSKPIEAVPLFQSIVAKDPSFGIAHLALADVAFRAKDPDTAVKELRAFFKSCPDALDGYDRVLRARDGAFSLERAVELRRKLAAARDPDALVEYSTLWKLEFKALPPARHPALRKQVAADLARVRAAAPVPDLPLLRVLDEGYRLSSDAEGLKWVAAENEARFGATQEAFFKSFQKWMFTHPAPDDQRGTPKERAGYRAAQFAAAGEWVKRWPRLPMAWSIRLETAPPELPIAELDAICEQVLALEESHASLPVASVYAERNFKLARVPKLVAVALADREKRLANFRAQKERFERALQAMSEYDDSQWSAWAALARAYSLEANAAKLREVVEAETKAVAAETKPAESQPSGSPLDKALRAEHQAWLLHARAYLAIAERHKPDALPLFLRAQAADPSADGATSPRAEAERLWKDLGGTDDGFKLLTERQQSQKSAAAESDWEKREEPLPPLALKDLAGRSWKSTDLKGKVVLAVAWATWCEPCKQELPHLQKLYEQTRKRKDLIILSLNVDDDIGLVEPFVKQAGYRFPVLFAGDFAKELHMNGIPASWVVDGKGVIRLQRIGFDESNQKWIEETLAAVERAR